MHLNRLLEFVFNSMVSIILKSVLIYLFVCLFISYLFADTTESPQVRFIG